MAEYTMILRRKYGRIFQSLSLFMVIVIIIVMVSRNRESTGIQSALNFITANRASGGKIHRTHLPNLKTCPRINNVVFLKVHKSGSTTLTTMLQRFALSNNLNVVLPNKKPGVYGFNYLGEGRNFTMKSVVPIPKGETYNVLCYHTIYNRDMFHKLIPKDKSSLYLAIIREPEERFVSSAFYYGLVKSLKNKVPGVNKTTYIFSEWLKNPWKFGVSMEAYNHMSYDFGVEMKYFNNDSYLEKYVGILDSDFDLVLLMNYFDESLMLLRRSLCWSHKDVVYLKRNAGKYNSQFALGEDDRKRLKKWLHADNVIYDHFRSRFWRQIEAEGKDLFEETAFFKDVIKRISDFCTHGIKRWPSIEVQASHWSAAFNLSREECQYMNMGENEFIKKLQKSAWQKYNMSISAL